MKDGINSVKPTGIGTDYDVTKVVPIHLRFTPKTARFIAKVSAVICRFTNLDIGNKPEELTMCITQDIEGDKYVVTDTVTTIQHGLSTSTLGGGEFRIDTILSLTSEDYDHFYIFFKVDKGTLDVDEVIVTWEDYQ